MGHPVFIILSVYFETAHPSIKTLHVESTGRRSTSETHDKNELHPIQELLKNTNLVQLSVKSLLHRMYIYHKLGCWGYRFSKVPYGISSLVFLIPWGNSAIFCLTPLEFSNSDILYPPGNSTILNTKNLWKSPIS